MKTNLLFGAALIASLAVSAPSTNAKSAMDHNLKCLWMNTDVAPLHTSARQGVAVNGKFYLQNKDTQKIEIWDQTGKVGELDSGKGTNITRDDAGNIIVRTGEFNTNYNVNKGVRIISPTGETKDFEIAGIPAGRADFWGHVSGNVLSDEGGILYMGTWWQPNMIEVPIKPAFWYHRKSCPTVRRRCCRRPNPAYRTRQTKLPTLTQCPPPEPMLTTCFFSL